MTASVSPRVRSTLKPLPQADRPMSPVRPTDRGFFTLKPLTELGGHLPALDGLRGFAVLLVFAVHGQLPFFDGGFIGVDVFFVLSGFLITQVLLRSYADRGSINLGEFYTRRFVRLVPALAVMCFAFSVYAVVSFGWTTVWQNIGPALTYITDFTRSRLGFPTFLAHTWSLAIEEQFYVVWPLALTLMLWGRVPVSVIAGALLATMLAVGAWRLWLLLDGAKLVRIYDGGDSHCDGLIAGCLLGISSRRTIEIAGRAWPLAVAILLSIVAFADWQSRLLYEGGFTFIALAAVSVIAALVTNTQRLGARIVASPPFRAIGVVSYGAYLWHFPLLLICMINYPLSFTASIAIVGPASIAVATVSFLMIERPLMKRRGRMPKPIAAITCVTGPICLLLGIAWIFWR